MTLPEPEPFITAEHASAAAALPAPTYPLLRDRVPAQSLIVELMRQRATRAMTQSVNPRTPRLSASEESWYVGAIGERKVAQLLAQLGPEFTVLHSVPVGERGSDIDHVVVGPSGVFTINTKRHVGKSIWVAGRTLMIGGQKLPHIRNAIHEARRAEKFLSAATGMTVPVTAIVALVDAQHLTIKKPVEGGDVTVRVLHVGRVLLNTINGRREFSDEQVARMTDAATRASTWSKLPLPHENPAELAAWFESLMGSERQYTAKKRRRRFWWGLVAAFAPLGLAYLLLTFLLNVLATSH